MSYTGTTQTQPTHCYTATAVPACCVAYLRFLAKMPHSKTRSGPHVPLGQEFKEKKQQERLTHSNAVAYNLSILHISTKRVKPVMAHRARYSSTQARGNIAGPDVRAAAVAENKRWFADSLNIYLDKRTPPLSFASTSPAATPNCRKLSVVHQCALGELCLLCPPPAQARQHEEAKNENSPEQPAGLRPILAFSLLRRRYDKAIVRGQGTRIVGLWSRESQSHGKLWGCARLLGPLWAAEGPQR